MTFLSMVKEYFGWTQNRPAEGFLSWQHLLYVTLMVSAVIVLAIVIGRKYRNADAAQKDKVLKISAIVILSCELTKIVLISFRASDPFMVRGMLPLFLCSINLFTIPIAAFGKGKLKELALDIIFIYGGICCLAGTYLAANYFSSSPVLSFDPMMSVTTHCITGFVSLFIPVSGMLKRNYKKFFQSFFIIIAIELLALLANFWNRDTDGAYEANYMFLHDSAGTPFEIVNTLVGGNQILYTVSVALIYILYGLLFIAVYAVVVSGINRKKAHKTEENAVHAG